MFSRACSSRRPALAKIRWSRSPFASRSSQLAGRTRNLRNPRIACRASPGLSNFCRRSSTWCPSSWRCLDELSFPVEALRTVIPRVRETDFVWTCACSVSGVWRSCLPSRKNREDHHSGKPCSESLDLLAADGIGIVFLRRTQTLHLGENPITDSKSDPLRERTAREGSRAH